MTAWLALVLWVAPVKPTLWVQVRGSPPAGCSFQSQLSRSLTDLNLALSPEPELSVTVGFESTPPVLRIERHGKQVLERKLGLLACSDLIEISSLIIDRFVTDVGWSGTSSLETQSSRSVPTPEISSASPKALPEASPAPPASDVGPAATPLLPAADGGVPQLPPPSSLEGGPPSALGFDGEATLGGALTDSGLAPTFGVELALKRGLWRVGLMSEVPLLPSHPVVIQKRTVGSFTPWQVHAVAAAGAQLRWRIIQFSAQLAAGALVTVVSPQGTFNRAQQGLGVLPELGVVLHALAPGPAGFAIGLVLQALFPVGSNTFDVEGTTASFRTSPFSVCLALELGWTSH